MKPLVFFFFFFLTLSSSSSSSSSSNHENFLECLYHYKYLNNNNNNNKTTSLSDVVYTKSNASSYSSVLDFSIHNIRFVNSSSKPVVIVSPVKVWQVQAVVLCARNHGLQIRTRSGGHDYEGLSYQIVPSGNDVVSFVLIDLINLSSIEVDVENKSAWVEAGASIGQLYYSIAHKSTTLAYPAGVCPTVGVGGHFSGGGYGFLMRKYGLAADNIIDAQIIDFKGRLLDKSSMGDDIFWAIRGGGASSFGIIVQWKINLVSVPSKVTVFSITRTIEQNCTNLVHKLQSIGTHLPKDLFLRARFYRVNNATNTTKPNTVVANFECLFLGSEDDLVSLMGLKFPELGLKREDCKTMRWIDSVLLFYGFTVDGSNSSLQVLLNRTGTYDRRFKAKSDFLKTPIPESGFQGIYDYLFEEEGEGAIIEMSPYGGMMDEIEEDEIPFPYRKGNLVMIQYLVYWEESGKEEERYLKWMRRLYEYMTPFVSKNPRAAYLNYRDIDLGMNRVSGKISYEEAKVWGVRYFGNNFDRLVRAKKQFDPLNFFRDEQSIPPSY